MQICWCGYRCSSLRGITPSRWFRGVWVKIRTSEIQAYSKHLSSMYEKIAWQINLQQAPTIQPYIPSIIHPEQIGFLPCQEGRDNSIKTISLTNYWLWNKTNHSAYCQLIVLIGSFCTILSVQFSTPPAFLDKMMALYNRPTDGWHVNGSFSDTVCGGFFFLVFIF